MSIAIIYMSKHGTTEKITELIKTKLDSYQTHIFNLKQTNFIDLTKFDTIIFGGSIHAAALQKKLKQYMNDNMTILLKKKIALFLVCMDKTDKRKTQFENAFPSELRDISIANGFMGGEFNFDKMNFIEKAIIKKISGKSSNVSEIDNAAIEKFIGELKN